MHTGLYITVSVSRSKSIKLGRRGAIYVFVFHFQWLGSVCLSPELLVTVTGSVWARSSILQRGCEHPAPRALRAQLPRREPVGWESSDFERVVPDQAWHHTHVLFRQKTAILVLRTTSEQPMKSKANIGGNFFSFFKRYRLPYGYSLQPFQETNGCMCFSGQGDLFRLIPVVLWVTCPTLSHSKSRTCTQQVKSSIFQRTGLL